MTTKLKWRLANRPTPAEVIALQESGLLTNDEAREILFSLETEEDRDKTSLQGEIKFLRALVDKMSTRSQILTYIPQVATPDYTNKPWWAGYQVYCANQESWSGNQTSAINTMDYNSAGTLVGSSAMANSLLSVSGSNGNNTVTYTYGSPVAEPSFTDIKTF